MSKIKKILNSMALLVECLIGVLLVLMILIISYQVFLRFVLNNPTSWSEELSIILLIWFGNLGISLGIRERKHISIDYLYNKFNPGTQKFLDVSYYVLLIIFSILMISEGLTILKVAQFQRMPATGITRSVFYMSLVVCGFLNIIYSIENCYETLKKKEFKLAEERL